MTKRDNIIKWSIISIFVGLYAMVSIISTIHVIDFFRMSNPEWLAITLAIAFEVGAAACLGAIVILNKTSKALVWMLFVLITVMQMMGNMYYAYSHVHDFQGWIELFGLNEEEPVFQKRILSLVSGAILPIVALGFIKSLVDYIRPSEEVITAINDQITDSVTQVLVEDDEEVVKPNEDLIDAKKVWDGVNRLRAEGKLPEITQEDIENEPTALANSQYREEYDEEEEYEKRAFNDDLMKDVVDEEIHIDKSKEVERRIAKVIAKNPELKAKLSEEIKKLEEEDKYTKPEESNIANVNAERRIFGGM